MKKEARLKIARDIVSRVKREMDKPRQTESVRNGFAFQAASAVAKPAARSAPA
jgi:hypothetical protein